MHQTSMDHVYEDSSALTDAVARAFIELVARVQATGRDPHVVLTGGSAAAAVHGKVASLAPHSAVDWSRVHFWWGDERFLPAEDEERNAVQARTAMLDPLGVAGGCVHAVPASDSVPEVETAAQQYAAELEAHAPEAFDLVMLSLGPDGHIASLFPGHAALDAESREWTVAVRESPKPPPERVSMTLGALSRTSELWVMAAGSEKAEMLARTRTTGAVSEAPLRALLHGEARVQWHMDEAAASRE